MNRRRFSVIIDIDMKPNDDGTDRDPIEDALLEAERNDEERAIARGIRYEADWIASLIIDQNASREDVEVMIAILRSDVLDVYPGKDELFDAIYLGRFRRLWEQFRPGEGSL